MFFKNLSKSQVPAEYKTQCCSWLGFSSRTGFDCIFPVVYCHLCVCKLVSACSGEMRHWWFGLLVLLQEMWLSCGSLVLSLSSASPCKCRGCDGICAKNHHRMHGRDGPKTLQRTAVEVGTGCSSVPQAQPLSSHRDKKTLPCKH